MKLKDIAESSIIEDLRNPEFTLGYLEEVLKQGSTPAFLEAVRLVAKANGGMKRLSNNTRLGRESLYKALALNGNPYFSTVQLVLKNLGFRFTIDADDSKKKAA